MAHRLTGDTEDNSYLDFGEAQFASMHGTEAEGFQDFIG